VVPSVGGGIAGKSVQMHGVLPSGEMPERLRFSIIANFKSTLLFSIIANRVTRLLVCSVYVPERIATQRIWSMALVYRVVAFGQPCGPWRTKKRQAEQDALANGLGEVDEWGQLYLDAPAAIEWRRAEDLKRCA
jgi:hypothetical protein